MSSIFADVNLLDKALDGIWIRNQIITDNIANIDTDGYITKDIDIEKSFSAYLNKYKKLSADNKSIGLDNIKFSIEEENTGSIKENGNNVNMEKEMTKLMENLISYNTVIAKLRSEFNKIKYVINEGRV